MKLPALGSLGSAQGRAVLIAQASSCLYVKGDRSLAAPVLPAFKLRSSAPAIARQFRSKATLVSTFGLMAALGSGCGPAQILNPTTDPNPSPTAALRASGGLVIPSPAPTDSSPQDSITLKLGDRSDRVRQVQQQLIRRGHLRADYPINQGDRYGNRYDEETAAAVAEFQKQVVGLPATGEATEATQVMLGLIPVPRPSDGLPWGPVKPGDIKQSVGTLQERLTRLGDFTGAIDWNYDSNTEAAVRNFQLECQCGLEPDGIANQITRSMMLIRLKQQEETRQSC
ncbi:peptidoglycan-binding protein [Thermoleptolyngbya sp. M55_K2018_002]|uniref:peptidoglycan-binding domain-containing protein n=1 Tax=Thermoleptolyngbya sp. M55_K2018_002 TaxID=2747808 RepID=UPI0019F29956|nr:peptidoglycan-binding protein [Thermoleptolyngbya sp. M55_K2018_002]HIK40852.1 peptidoglycan-binding protein [Thermoleptolyngbya sp. M55_K2018_002]